MDRQRHFVQPERPSQRRCLHHLQGPECDSWWDTYSGLDIETLQGHVQGTAMLAWQPRFKASIDIKADSLDPGVLFAEWPGSLDVQLTGHAELDSGGLVAQLPRLL